METVLHLLNTLMEEERLGSHIFGNSKPHAELDNFWILQLMSVSGDGKVYCTFIIWGGGGIVLSL